MVQSSREHGRKRYGPGSARERHDDRGEPVDITDRGQDTGGDGHVDAADRHQPSHPVVAQLAATIIANRFVGCGRAGALAASPARTASGWSAEAVRRPALLRTPFKTRPAMRAGR